MDCPGHDILMATMLNGAAVMDAALLLIGKSHGVSAPRRNASGFSRMTVLVYGLNVQHFIKEVLV